MSWPISLKHACKATTISGAEVPTATKVRPMMTLETPKFLGRRGGCVHEPISTPDERAEANHQGD